MTGERRLRILARLVSDRTAELETKRLCQACAEVTAATCAGIMRTTGRSSSPCPAQPATPRWPAFTGPALRAGVRAIFGFPLQVGAVRPGALNLYRNRAEPLDDEQHADALVMADVAAQAVLLLQVDAPPGKLASELEAGADFHLAVQQAAGMVAAQLEMTVGHALIRLRAYAFGNDRPLAEVARDVVARRLRFEVLGGAHDAGAVKPPRFRSYDGGSDTLARRNARHCRSRR